LKNDNNNPYKGKITKGIGLRKYEYELWQKQKSRKRVFHRLFLSKNMNDLEIILGIVSKLGGDDYI
jgi:hypothetical protein